MSRLAVWKAGASPKISAVNIAMPRLNSKTGKLKRIAPRAGSDLPE